MVESYLEESNEMKVGIWIAFIGESRIFFNTGQVWMGTPFLYSASNLSRIRIRN